MMAILLDRSAGPIALSMGRPCTVRTAASCQGSSGCVHGLRATLNVMASEQRPIEIKQQHVNSHSPIDCPEATLGGACRDLLKKAVEACGLCDLLRLPRGVCTCDRLLRLR